MNPKKFVRKVLPSSGIKSAEETYRKSRIRALQVRYGYPASNLRVIAVTGTNGKTTTCAFINEMLKSAGYKTALFTTAVVEVAGTREINHRHTTVPVTAELLRFLRDARDDEADYVILEVSSHALHQHKLLDIPVEVAVMTNLSQDHLDYHGTMEEYAAAKARLFNRYMNPTYCVLNADDRRFKYYEKESVGLVSSYGKKAAADVKVSYITPTDQGSSFTLQVDGQKTKASIQLMGEFNVYNAAAAATVGSVLGLDLNKIKKGLGAFEGVPGRMQEVDEGQAFTTLVDYAVTPDAMEQALRSLKERGKGKVSIVFGATGDRDKDKRPHMGEVAARYADSIYLTDDETYTEDPQTIRDGVMRGIAREKGVDKVQEISDRKTAIAAALAEAKKGDTVYITGIGHQDSRNMGGTLEKWDEVKIVSQLLKKHQK